MAKRDEWQTASIPIAQLQTMGVSTSLLYRGKVNNPKLVRRAVLPQFTWWRILKGVCHLEACGEKRQIRAGEWVLIPAGVLREQRFDDASEIVSINLFCTWPGGNPVLQIPRILTGRSAAIPGVYALADRICQALEAHTPPDDRRAVERYENYAPSLSDYLIFRAELHRFVERLLGYAAARGAWIQRLEGGDTRLEKVLSELRSDPMAGPLPYARWQTEVGVGRSHLERLAVRHLGFRLHTYRDRFLLLRACDLLMLRALRVKEIAGRLGFVDSAHFCRWIRHRTGHSPQNLRTAPV